jgi:hypothetical protein
MNTIVVLDDDEAISVVVVSGEARPRTMAAPSSVLRTWFSWVLKRQFQRGCVQPFSQNRELRPPG